MKIQSVSDIITNSSSEVFIIDADYADVFKKKIGTEFDIMDIDYLRNYPYMVDTICELAGIEQCGIDDADSDQDWYEDCMNAFIDGHAKEFNEFFSKGLAFMVLEDADFYDPKIIADIKNLSLWSDFQ